MKPSEVLRARRDEVLAIIAKYPVSNPRIFGSVARGEDDEASDIDILIDPENGLDYFALGGLQIELEELTGVRVDISIARALKPHVRPNVMADQRPL